MSIAKEREIRRFVKKSLKGQWRVRAEVKTGFVTLEHSISKDLLYRSVWTNPTMDFYRAGIDNEFHIDDTDHKTLIGYESLVKTPVRARTQYVECLKILDKISSCSNIMESGSVSELVITESL